MKIKFAIILFAIFGYFKSFSQTESDTVDYALILDQLEAELDSFGIFSLFDSILTLEQKIPNEINIRVGYNSNVQSAGRDFDIQQYGINAGLSFFHRSGLYLDAGGYWNSEMDPQYNLTVISAGYMNSFFKKFSYAITYDKWFYNFDQTETSSTYPTNSLGGSLYYDLKYINLGFDYNYLFGGESAHRLSPNITGYIKIPTFWGIKRITLMPYVSMIYGNDDVVIQFAGSLIDILRSNIFLQQNLRTEEFQTFLANVQLTPEQKQNIARIQNSRRLSDERKNKLISAIYLATEEVQDYIYNLIETSTVEYGIMNYTVALPLSVSLEKFSFLLSYSYNIPKKLPGEIVELDPFGFLSLTISYRIPLR